MTLADSRKVSRVRIEVAETCREVLALLESQAPLDAETAEAAGLMLRAQGATLQGMKEILTHNDTPHEHVHFHGTTDTDPA